MLDGANDGLEKECDGRLADLLLRLRAEQLLQAQRTAGHGLKHQVLLAGGAAAANAHAGTERVHHGKARQGFGRGVAGLDARVLAQQLGRHQRAHRGSPERRGPQKRPRALGLRLADKLARLRPEEREGVRVPVGERHEEQHAEQAVGRLRSRAE